MCKGYDGPEKSAFEVLAVGAQARTFPAVGMAIDFGAGDPTHFYMDVPPAERPKIVFLLEDLPAACINLQRKVDWYGRHSPNLDIRITLSPHLGHRSSVFQHGFPVPGSKLWECFDPLRNVRGANFVGIDGIASLSHTTSILAKVREGPPDPRTFVAMIEARIDQGSQAPLQGDLESTIDLYKATLNTVRARYLDEDEQHQVILGGRFNNCQTGQ